MYKNSGVAQFWWGRRLGKNMEKNCGGENWEGTEFEKNSQITEKKHDFNKKMWAKIMNKNWGDAKM